MPPDQRQFAGLRVWFSPHLRLDDLALKDALRDRGATMVDKCSMAALHVVSNLADVRRARARARRF